MKKGKKILDKVVYEENPWEDEPVGGEFVKDFLPPPSKMKNASIIYIDDGASVPLPLGAGDLKILHSQAKKAGISPEAFIIGVMHDFLTGKLVRPNG